LSEFINKDNELNTTILNLSDLTSEDNEINTTILSLSELKNEDNNIDSSIIYPKSTNIYSDNLNEEAIYVINSRVFLLGYTNFNIINSNIFSFFIYFMALKNTIYSQMLYFSLTITYNNNLRILQDDVEAKCIKVEPIKEEFNKYNCSVQIKNSNINDINLSTEFNFKPTTTFNSFYYSSLADMNLFNFPNITDKEYNSPEIFILDNSTVYKYNNTHFKIKGIIENSHPKLEENTQLLIENTLSKNDKFKKINCTISNEISNYYNLLCKTNEEIEFSLQGSVGLTGENLILINLENDNEKLTLNNREDYNDSNSNKYFFQKENKSKKWVIAVIIVVIIIVLLIVIAVIRIFVLRKRNPPVQEEFDTEINLKTIN